MEVKTLLYAVGITLFFIIVYISGIDGGGGINYYNVTTINQTITGGNVTNNITYYINTTTNLTNNLTNNITYYINTTINITNNITQNITGGNNISVINRVASLNVSAYQLCLAANNGDTGNCDGNDATGSSSGISFSFFNKTISDIGSYNSTSVSPLNGGSTVFMLVPYSANKNVSLECSYNGFSTIATTGKIWNITSSTAIPQMLNYHIIYSTSATATTGCPLTLALQRTVLNYHTGGSYFPCIETGEHTAPVLPSYINAQFSTNASGYLNLTFRSEIMGTERGNATNITRGSWCRTTEVNY